MKFIKFVFAYLANTVGLCYSLTIICCCQVQDYIYWIISTENDHRHHHKLIKYEKRLIIIKHFHPTQRSNWLTIFKSIHMAFYVNTSWAWSLFRNNKQHVVLGQKRNCQRVEESGRWPMSLKCHYVPSKPRCISLASTGLSSHGQFSW
jgi:hypothetical protein